MALWVAVHGFQNNENVEFDVLNRPVFELTERTNYLYEQLQGLLGTGAFESVRLTQVTVETVGTLAPAAGDFVYLNETTGLYTKALADVAPDSAFSASNSSLAVGMVVSLFLDKATIVLFGREPLTTNGVGWNLNSLVQAGETFRNGPYYLSPSEPGKMTAFGSGIAIYLGYFMEDPDNPGFGGQVLLSPQYKDLKSAHIHRAYPLFAQPAGTQLLSGLTPIDTHAVLGFEADDISGQALPVPDRQPRLVPLGTWTGISDAQYTLWLSNSPNALEARAGSLPPTSWSDLYLHWQSSDAVEGQGVQRVWAFDTPVTIGSSGLLVSIENPDNTLWDTPYVVDTDNVDKRTWYITAPTQTRGWLARYYRQYCTGVVSTDNKFSVVLSGGPMTADDERMWEYVTVKCGKLTRLAYTGQPVATEVLTVNGINFEFTTTGVVTGGNYAVNIGTVADDTYQDLVDQLVAVLISAGYDAAINIVDGHVIILSPAAGTVSTTGITNAALALAAVGAGDLVDNNFPVAMLVYDEYHKALVPTDSYWANVRYWTPVTLTNGLRAMVIPYSNTGVPASANTVVDGDYWSAQLRDEAPGAMFSYAMGMHTGLLQYYPPMPLNAAVLVLNGIELTSYDQFPTNPTFRLGTTTIYWYPSTLQTVPWPRDWASVTSTGSVEYTQNLLMHFVKLSAGEAGIVTSLRPAPNSPVRVLQCGTNDPGTVGDLAIDVDLNLQDEYADLTGFNVFKGVSGQKLRRGPVVEKVISTDGSVVITSSVGAPAGQGVVDITIGGQSYGGDFEEVALQNAKQEMIGMFPYIRLMGWRTGSASNVNTGFVAKFRVPHDIGVRGAPPRFKVLVYMTVFGESDIPWIGGGTDLLAGIDFSYSILPDFTQINNNPAWPTAPGDVTSAPAWNNLRTTTLPEGLLTVASPLRVAIPLGRYQSSPEYPIYTAYDPMLIHNNPNEGSDEGRKIAQVLGNPFPVKEQLSSWEVGWGDPVVRPGSLVAIKVERADVVNNLREYTGGLGFINMRWKLVGVTGA